MSLYTQIRQICYGAEVWDGLTIVVGHGLSGMRRRLSRHVVRVAALRRIHRILGIVNSQAHIHGVFQCFVLHSRGVLIRRRLIFVLRRHDRTRLHWTHLEVFRPVLIVSAVPSSKHHEEWQAHQYYHQRDKYGYNQWRHCDYICLLHVGGANWNKLNFEESLTQTRNFWYSKSDWKSHHYHTQPSLAAGLSFPIFVLYKLNQTYKLR